MDSTTKTPKAADRRLSHHGGMLMRTVQTLLSGDPHPDADSLVHALDSCVEPSRIYRCLNPVCDQECVLGSGQKAGRPPRFCSRRCRQMFNRVRERLLWEVEVISTTLESSGQPTYVQRQRMASALAHRRWALTRYPAPPADQEDNPQ